MANKKKLIYADDARRAILEADPKLAYCIERIKGVDAVEIPDCNKCAFNEGIAHWHQCENCLGQARNNFVSISEVINDGK